MCAGAFCVWCVCAICVGITSQLQVLFLSICPYYLLRQGLIGLGFTKRLGRAYMLPLSRCWNYKLGHLFPLHEFWRQNSDPQACVVGNCLTVLSALRHCEYLLFFHFSGILLGFLNTYFHLSGGGYTYFPFCS